MQLTKPEYAVERKREKRRQQAEKRDFQILIRELDGGLCQNPHCGNSWYWKMQVQGHHIQYLSDGGTHEAHNGISLCGLCHREAHRSRNWVLALLIELRGEYNAGTRKSFRWQKAIEELERKER